MVDTNLGQSAIVSRRRRGEKAKLMARLERATSKSGPHVRGIAGAPPGTSPAPKLLSGHLTGQQKLKSQSHAPREIHLRNMSQSAPISRRAHVARQRVTNLLTLSDQYSLIWWRKGAYRLASGWLGPLQLLSGVCLVLPFSSERRTQQTVIVARAHPRRVPSSSALFNVVCFLGSSSGGAFPRCMKDSSGR